MADKSVEPKRRGRPATGRDPIVGVRLPPAEIEALDAWAKANNLKRSEAVRHAISAVVQMGGLAVKPAASPLTVTEVEPRVYRHRGTVLQGDLPKEPPAMKGVASQNEVIGRVVKPRVAGPEAPSSLRAVLDSVQVGPKRYVPPGPKKGR